ncbi:SUMF1/EgtB/PvdO family nonheme iron enzyme [Haliscomenobacter hydrossis]|uniref:Sulphatase-modifying factor protein n=1 Tax=Haliscomenobacter hydrossis (strain ATCC 27775 / DSM 1100 / LMG 10767 / O) TaxID=760192 RepID=F4L865_HALH1|nr:SUMF1/EgtB/PvdO family nonheme iron enzyme [Haliscomenobacter hydrossis]AEE54573.1 Sulphatase-modifying factor protein [Haliscomenobacter hydrossis DSM 1100]
MADRDLVRKDRQSSNASSPKGTNYLLAIAINDYLHCSKLSNAYTDFYDQYPTSQYRRQALDKMEELEEQDAWRKVPKTRLAALLRFMEDNPHSPHFKEAQQLASALREAAAKPSVAEAAKEQKSIVPPLIITPKFAVPDHMVLVKGGTFQMGEDKAVHPVTLSDFLIAKYPLTFDEYDAFCKATGRKLPSDEGWGRGQRPAINVCWFDTVDYCNWRSQQNGFQKVYQVNQFQVIANWQADGYRLPTEEEWEYAAKGGQNSQGYEYAGSNNADVVAWYNENSGGKSQLVGQKKANELGLHDMSGNVWEWCWDEYIFKNNSISLLKHGCRGGGWHLPNKHAMIEYHYNVNPKYSFSALGFRLVRSY